MLKVIEVLFEGLVKVVEGLPLPLPIKMLGAVAAILVASFAVLGPRTAMLIYGLCGAVGGAGLALADPPGRHWWLAMAAAGGVLLAEAVLLFGLPGL